MRLPEAPRPIDRLHTWRRPPGRSHWIVVCVIALGLGAWTLARAANPDALWKIVHGTCVPDARSGDPAPCVEVTADAAVLKDIAGRTQFLLIPTSRITGIESPALLAPGAPNFFAAAWQARHFVTDRLGRPLPWDGVALAINPPSARSQDQLHIHIDCIRPDVRDALRAWPIGDAWAMLPAPLVGQRYQAMRLHGAALDRNPFRLLADGLPGAGDAMTRYTLVVTGSDDAQTGPGFILLAGEVGPDGRGHGEDLEDQDCAIARQPPKG